MTWNSKSLWQSCEFQETVYSRSRSRDWLWVICTIISALWNGWDLMRDWVNECHLGYSLQSKGQTLCVCDTMCLIFLVKSHTLITREAFRMEAVFCICFLTLSPLLFLYSLGTWDVNFIICQGQALPHYTYFNSQGSRWKRCKARI